MSTALRALIPLIHKKSNLTDPGEFHSLINVVFHDREAKYYDKLHAEMWQSLPQQYQLFINDITNHLPGKNGWCLLDVGCGTGLATQMLLNTGLKDCISEVHLLDTSSTMLKEAQKRSKKWNKKIKTIHGDIGTITGQYDFVVISSVLHHIPDLHAFLQKLGSLQNPGGIIFTIHDPANEALQNEKYIERCRQYRQYMQAHPPSLSLQTRVFNKIKRLLKPDDYMRSINKDLLKNNIIKEPLTATELWSITDIHVEGLPYSANQGISLAELTKSLAGYHLLSYRTYGFFGALNSNLPDQFKEAEQQLIAEGDKFGRNFGSVWIKQ